MAEPIRVLLVDDQSLVRSGFHMLIDSEDDMAVVGEASNGAEALEKLRTTEVDVALMDIRMPVMDGVETTRRIAASSLPTRVMILTTFDLDEYVYAVVVLDLGCPREVGKALPHRNRESVTTGKLTATQKPPSSRGPTVSAPPIDETRSRMPCRPCPIPSPLTASP